jgi:hypothetical protein
MRFTLKDYQGDAVADVLRNLVDARDDWHAKRRRVAFSLTATTGAGKTVMAAAAIEALFEGDPDFDFEADPAAVVLWFTDDPSLNVQTRSRLMEASDRLTAARLVVIENTFNQEKLEPGKVYFLNAQKLSKNAMLVRGALEEGEQFSTDGGSQMALTSRTVSPDLRQFSFWDILRNTIEDQQLTLYVILDEAHRGMKPKTQQDRADKQTTVRRLINGAGGAPAVPIVWGISATVERFNEAMTAAEGRTTYPAVVVDPVRVQASGLLKDDVRLDFPAESGQFDTVLLRRATKKVFEATALWRDYAKAQDPPADPVAPLLVVQVPNKPSDELLLAALDTIRDAWRDLPHDAIAHVFGEHQDLELGNVVIPHIRPEQVQEASRVRVLFAKDAISTGWDCPRAEVLVSFRPAQDQTHITQLLGRMVRTPLARRIPGNDRLNSVECVLPHFNRKTATGVADILLGKGDDRDDGSGGTGGGDGRRILLAPVDMKVNAAIPPQVWDAFDRLPSQTVPRKAAKPVRRLAALAQALSRDGLRTNARKAAYDELFGVLDGAGARFTDKIEEASHKIVEVEGETIVATVSSKETAPPAAFTELADDRSVEADFRTAGRLLSADLARRYAEHIAVEGPDDDGLFDAHVRVAALAKLEEVRGELDRAADELVRKWLDEHRVAIKGLADERRAVYDEIIAMSRDPQRIEILRPRVRAESTKDAEGNLLPTKAGHLMSATEGEFPIGSLKSSWERRVLEAEMGRPDFLAWYRNPSRGSEDSLAIAYQDGKGAWRRMCPDFVFFHGDKEMVRTSIVDPHGFHLSDALSKLRGLANYAEEFRGGFHRIESVAEIKGGALRVLDLKVAAIRKAIRDSEDAEALYLSDVASDYL